MSASIVQNRPTVGYPRHMAWSGLALAIAFWLLLFHAEATAAVTVWLQSTAFGHCFLIIPIAAWLAWDRRAAAWAAPLHPVPWAALCTLPLGVLWLAAERLGIMEGRQLAAMAMLQVLAFAVLGRRLYVALSVPLLYLFFLVPFGDFLVPVLQRFTANFVGVGLGVLGVPHVITQYLIEIPEGAFRVAEACAGLRFLIAAIAFGVLYACLIYRTAWKRLAFIAVSFVVPVVANGFRALGIVELGHLLGSPEAAAVDHVLYGWLFFSIVIVLLILAGLPFREDGPDGRLPPSSRVSSTPRTAAVAAAAAATIMLAAAGPAIAMVLDMYAAAHAEARAGDAAAILGTLIAPPGCVRQAAGGTGQFVCAGVAIGVQAEVFGPRASATRVWAKTHAAGAELEGDDTEADDVRLPRDGGVTWHVLSTDRPPVRALATGLWIGGEPSPGGLSARLTQAKASVVGSVHRAVLVIVAAHAEGSEGVAIRQTLLSFLTAQPALTSRVREISAGVK